MSRRDGTNDRFPLARLLRALVRRPSINPMNGAEVDSNQHFEGRVGHFLERWAGRRGIPCEVQPVAPHRNNVILRYSTSRSQRAILLEVHQDTVPVEGMTVDPFGGRIAGGRLYGRGACDVKGGMAAMLGVIGRLHREKPSNAANVILACTVDEEYGNLGVRALMQSKIQADMAVCAEPTNLQIVDAHKGVTGWRVTVPGRACHSSRPDDGINAIYRMGHLLGAIEKYTDHLGRMAADHRLGRPTLNVGKISGGVSVNTVPDCCTIEIDRRLLPGERPEDAPRDFTRFLTQSPGIDFPFTVAATKTALPPLASQNNGELLSRLGSAIDSVIGSHRVEAVPYGTDASSIAEAGIPCVVFGPGDIAQAHTVDEWIDLEQVEKAAEILFRFITMEG